MLYQCMHIAKAVIDSERRETSDSEPRETSDSEPRETSDSEPYHPRKGEDREVLSGSHCHKLSPKNDLSFLKFAYCMHKQK